MWYREKYDIIAYEANYNSVKLWVAYSVGPIYCFISQCSRRRTAKFFLPSYIFLSLIFSSAIPWSSLSGTQLKPAKHSKVNGIWKCVPKIPPLKLGAQTTFFRCFSTISQLNGKFNGEYLLSETRFRKWGNGTETVSKFHEHWSTTGLK